MLTPKVHIPQTGILAGCKCIELDLSRGILVRRLKPADIAKQIQEFEDVKYLYIRVSQGNLQDKTLKKLLEHLAALDKALYMVTDSSGPEGVAAVLHTLSGIELNFADVKQQNIERICLLAAARELQLNLRFEQVVELNSFLPLFSQLNLSNINVYLPSLDGIGALPDNVRVFKQ